MFYTHGMSIYITQGDTGLLTLITEGHTFAEGDRAVFTVRKDGGETIMEVVAVLEPDGKVQIGFDHEITETWETGNYNWDIRYVLDAEIDEQGHVTGGREVVTPMWPEKMYVMKAVGTL